MIALIRSNLDTVVGIGLVGLAPETVTPRMTGTLGLITSLIACYQVSRLSVELIDGTSTCLFARSRSNL